MTEEKKYNHNQIIEWIEKEFHSKKGYMVHRNLEDFPELRKDFEQKSLPIDPRLPVDLICAKEVEEPTEDGKDKFWHYTIFLVNSTESISESLMIRLSFYQFYLSRITSIQPNRLMIIIAIPHYFDEIKQKYQEFLEKNGFGLWRIDIDKNEKKEEVTARNLRDRMIEEFNKAVDEPDLTVDEPEEQKKPEGPSIEKSSPLSSLSLK